MTNMHSAIVRMTRMYAPTLREDPSDADIMSAKLLVRGGMLRKEAGGLYSFLPLGMRVLRKIETIIREEMDSAGAQEMLMPFLQRAELWKESGRWNAYGPELLRVVDRHQNEFCLSPTHEEIITDLVRNELRSYKELPKNLYQMQIKFRDEIRPRFGLLRSREFIMKDAYSFNESQESLDQSYQEMRDAYCKIYDRIGMKYRIVQADPGQIGGNCTEEFMGLADTGEAELVHCTCGYAADTEVGACSPQPTEFAADAKTLVETPGVHTIAELAQFLGCEESSCAKAFAGKNDEGEIWVVFVPGNYEVNECKVSNALGGFEALTDEEMEQAGLPKGSMGPVDLPSGIKIAADASLKAISRWVVGANKDGYHYTGALQGEDFKVDLYGDYCVVKPGDACPECGLPLQHARGIEVGQIFKLGDKYSRAMGATFMNEQGKEVPFIMGCYGIGVSRTLAAIIEQCHDEFGMYWPVGVAPAHVCLIPMSIKDDLMWPYACELAEKLRLAGVEVALDDRDERAGVKFADADLIGWPYQIVLGKRSLEAGSVEMKCRATNEKKLVSQAALEQMLERRFNNPQEIEAAFTELFESAEV